MFSDLGAPTVQKLAGHWYLIASTPGFLETSPKIETLQGYSVPRDETSFVFDCLATSPGRIHTFSKIVLIESTKGASYTARFLGALALMKSWEMGLSSDGQVHSGFHPGSMLIPGGLLLYVRAELTEEEGQAAIRSHASEIGLSARDLETLVWRTRPTDIVVGEVPHFVKARRSGVIDMVRAIVGTRADRT